MTSEEKVRRRLSRERNIWLATVRPNRAPHLVPIWFVWHDGRIYICTDPDSVKVRNLRRNKRVAAALEDGTHPIIIEGTARVLALDETPDAVVALFKSKYDWNIRDGDTYTVVVEITPSRRLGW